MTGARTVKGARVAAHVAIATAHEASNPTPDLDEDVRRVVPKWADVLELIEGARKRGWTEQQMDYLTAVVGITWTKAYHRGHEDAIAEFAAKAEVA